MDITRERIRKIIDAGARIVLTTKGVDDLCMKYFVEAGIICARRCNREDLKRLAKADPLNIIERNAKCAQVKQQCFANRGKICARER